ncbi:Peroxiredoxin-5, mitochondrial, partial [Perkinsus olseni]
VITIDFPVDPPQVKLWTELVREAHYRHHSGKLSGRAEPSPHPKPWPMKQALLTREEQALARQQEILTMCNGALSVDHIIEQFNERPERKGQAYRMMNRDEAFRLLEDAAKSNDIHLYLIWKCFSVAVGDALPDVAVREADPGDKKSLRDIFGNDKGILFGVPGAFTPTCDQSHLPGFIRDYDKLQQKGVKTVACMAVNDAFVMQAWGKIKGADGKVRMLSDVDGDAAKALGTDFDASGVLGPIRTKRFAAIIDNGKITDLEVEPDGTGLSCSRSSNIMEKL